MQYLLLIYSNDAEFAARPQAELGTIMADYGAFTAPPATKQTLTAAAGAIF